MLPHQQRVVDELAELTDRIEKLSKFINDVTGPFKTLDLTDQGLLISQFKVMTQYRVILEQRIARF